jgi:hypothetical protein
MDTLIRTKKLEALGFDRPKAEGLVLMVKESIDEEVAKKSDVSALKSDLTVLNSKIDHVESKLTEKIDHVESSLRAEIERVEQTIGLKITSESKSLFIKILILMITITGIILREIK